MKKIETIEKHVETKKVISEIICDLCERNTSHSEGNWDDNEISIRAKIGSVYPEADTRTMYVTDICSECFLNKIKPALNDIGVNFREINAEDEYNLMENK